MLTKKGKYGLKAMVHLAGLEPDALAQVADIAKTNSISKKFLDHILTEPPDTLASSTPRRAKKAATLSHVRRMRSRSGRLCALSMVL